MSKTDTKQKERQIELPQDKTKIVIINSKLF